MCCAAELPLEFPDGTTPVMSRICIYDSAVGGGTGVGSPLKIALPPQLPSGSLYMEEVHAKVRDFGCISLFNMQRSFLIQVVFAKNKLEVKRVLFFTCGNVTAYPGVS